jgi:lipopolysaccharide transport system ATP-binding protein
MLNNITSNAPILSLRNVGVSYTQKSGFLKKKKYWALKDVSFDLFQGETLGVIGRNGAGKSTLLRLIAGILAPDHGQLVRRSANASLLSLAVGFSPYLTGRQNAILSGLLLGMRRHEIESKMDEIVAFAELGDFFDQPVNTYSTGMKARLGFSVAIQADQDIILVDEVLGVGDEDFKIKSSKALKDKIRSEKSVIIVSHNIPTLKELCNRVVWIENGKTVADGPSEDILRRYQEMNRRGRSTETPAIKAVK